MEPLRVAFLGPAASFSHQAAVESFGPSASLYPKLSFADAFASVQNTEADFAIIPFENSTNGSVVQTLDLLADRKDLYKDVKVCGEHYLTVHHCLLARKDAFPSNPPDYSSITKLYTHPQAWGQCEIFLSKHFKGVERQDVSSTSKAAEIVLKTPTELSAAIASKFAAEYHGLAILAENIEDKADNTTRFLVLRNVKSERTAQITFDQVKGPVIQERSELAVPRKTLISFLLRQNAPGALADALLVFKDHGMNLTSISTRPSHRQAWRYVFFVEGQRVLTDENKEAVDRILQSLRAVTDSCRDWGTWKDQLLRAQAENGSN
ncbi:Prephenate dehydratase [Aspergillus sclerotialis]|uniref:prephenate dehydratase n=1 Tax=Aspergillus sclerotialis TaxID=2070753 RepID=A0A3A2ZG14_9EURO|nr:Prephenate dehydratase [Aspergillus sclerotialis]